MAKADNVQGLVTVPVASSWYSKINWTQAIGIGLSGLVMLGIDVPPETRAQIIVGIQSVTAVVTWFFRTFMTKTITPASI